jgi:hypothetical protein
MFHSIIKLDIRGFWLPYTKTPKLEELVTDGFKVLVGSVTAKEDLGVTPTHIYHRDQNPEEISMVLTQASAKVVIVGGQHTFLDWLPFVHELWVYRSADERNGEFNDFFHMDLRDYRVEDVKRVELDGDDFWRLTHLKHKSPRWHPRVV